MAPDIVITKITASPIPIAESLLFDIPKKGHSPKNLDKRTLFINAAEIKSKTKFIC